MIYTKDEHKSLDSLISNATKCYKENDLYNKNSIKFIELNNLDLNSKNDLDLNKVDKSKILSVIYKDKIPNTIPLVNNKKDGKGKYSSHVLNRFDKRQKNIYDNNKNIINTEKFLDILKQYYQGILEIDNDAKNHLDKYNDLENLVLLIKKDNQLQYKLVVGRNVDNLSFYEIYSDDLLDQFVEIVGNDELDKMIDEMITDEMIINSLDKKSKYFQLRPFIIDLKTKTITIQNQKFQLESVDKLFSDLFMIYKHNALTNDEIINTLINSCEFYMLNNTDEILDKLDLKRLLFKSHHWILSTIMDSSMNAKAQIQAVRTINEKNRIEDDVIENIILDEITNKILPILNKVKKNPSFKNVKEVLTLLNWDKKYIKENVNKQNYKEIFVDAGLETEIPIKSLNGSIIYTLKVCDYKIKDIEIESINYEKVSQSIKSINIH